MLCAKLLLAILPVFWLLPPSQAQEVSETDSTINLESITCRSLIEMDDEGKNITLIFFHGLITGRRDEMIFDSEALSQTTEQIVDHCIDNPEDLLISAFEEYR